MSAPSSGTVSRAVSGVQLDVALAQFQSTLDESQRKEFQKAKTVPDVDAVMVFTAELDAKNRSRKGRSRSSRLHTILSKIRDFCSVMETSTLVSARPDVAALVWGSVSLTMNASNDALKILYENHNNTRQIIINLTSYFEAASKLFMELGKLCPVFTEYQVLYPSSTRLREALNEFHSCIIEVCTHVVLALRRPCELVTNPGLYISEASHH